MNHVTGIPRLQMQITSSEDSISQENLMRLVDAFVEQLNLLNLGFEVKTIKKILHDMKLYKVFYEFMNEINGNFTLRRLHQL